jgi:hypothetical protein
LLVSGIATPRAVFNHDAAYPFGERSRHELTLYANAAPPQPH